MAKDIIFAGVVAALGFAAGWLVWLHYQLKLARFDVGHFQKVAKLYEADAAFWRGATDRWKVIAETALGSNAIPLRWPGEVAEPEDSN